MDDATQQASKDPLFDPRTEIDALKAEIAELRAAERESEGAWKRWFAAIGTASVTLLAFLIPSLQEQWDRKQQADAEAEYRAVAAELLASGHAHEAEQLLGQALEQAGALRPELDRARLRAKTEQVNADPAWSGKIADDLSETDFVVLEAMLARAEDRAGQAWTMNNHAVFVANRGEPAQALALLRGALQLRPDDARLQVTLGNLLWDAGSLPAAGAAYRAALQHDPDNARARYNLGLLYEELGDREQAAREWRVLLQKNPEADVHDDLVRVEGKMPLSRSAAADTHAI